MKPSSDWVSSPVRRWESPHCTSPPARRGRVRGPFPEFFSWAWRDCCGYGIEKRRKVLRLPQTKIFLSIVGDSNRLILLCHNSLGNSESSLVSPTNAPLPG